MDYKDLLTRLYAGFKANDAKTVLSMLDEDVQFLSYGPKELPWAGIHRGHEGAMVFMVALTQNLSEFEEYTILQIAVDGDSAFLRGQSSGHFTATGKHYFSPFVHYYQFKNGKVSPFQEYYDTASQANAFLPD